MSVCAHSSSCSSSKIDISVGVARSDTTGGPKRTLQIAEKHIPELPLPLALHRSQCLAAAGGPHRPLPCHRLPSSFMFPAMRANVPDAACRPIYPPSSRRSPPTFSHIGSRGRRSGCRARRELHTTNELDHCKSHPKHCCTGWRCCRKVRRGWRSATS